MALWKSRGYTAPEEAVFEVERQGRWQHWMLKMKIFDRKKT
ncbi:MAG: hypothetical protein WCA45_04965 [Thiobacillaceae bacterium]